jgi:nickel/cobalt transporter (NiCoT) family protein
MYALLIAANAVAWGLAFVFFAPPHALLLGTAVLAYAFGVRHAVDADHISAIDNVTRKLMQEGKRPVAVGFYFSLGHSTIVVALTLLIAAGAALVREHLPALEAVGGGLGTAISASFLFVIAAINALVLADVVAAVARMRRDGTYCDATLTDSLDRRGLLGRALRPLLRLVTRSRHMYFIGLLFGLGFDTATEVGLLGVAAIEAGKGLPIWAILIFPALFAAGMSLIDTTDGVLMLGAYGWAFSNPGRKLYYNLTVTALSVAVAAFVGASELAGISGGWQGYLGYAIVGAFAACWFASLALHAVRRRSRGYSAATATLANGTMPSASSQASR